MYPVNEIYIIMHMPFSALFWLMKSMFENNVSPDCCLFLGEHIDYCGYSVLPMAIEQDVVIAVATTESEDILLSNVKSGVYRYWVHFFCIALYIYWVS